MKKIFVDMDGVLCDFVKQFGIAVNKLGYKFDIVKSKSYDLRKAIPAELKTAQEILETIFMDDNFWTNIPVFDKDTVEVLEKLYNEHDVWIVTTPYPPKKNCEELKIEWVKKHLPFFNTKKILFSKEKWLLDADCIIEDNSQNIRHFKGVTVCIDAPYNRDIEPTYRVKNWKELEKIIIKEKALDKKHKEKGVKFNYGKLLWSLVDFESLEPMVEVLMHGAKKYSPDNWKNVDPYEYVDSLLRHVTEFSDEVRKNKGKKKKSFIADHDSKLRLIGHIMCNALFISYFEKQGKL